MLEIARPEARAAAATRSHASRSSWGIVDVILGILMLPFGLGFLLIELIANTISAPFDR